MKKTYDYVSKVGASCAPNCGLSGAFYPRQFVSTRTEWVEKAADAFVGAETLFESANPDPDSNNVCPCGEIRVERRDGYIYLYTFDSWGQWQSEWFTTHKIAGENWYEEAWEICLDVFRKREA